jgi:uncharacterized protein DUF4282
MKSFFTFRKMLTPLLVQFLFWVALIFFIIIAIIDIIHHISWRVVLEIIILGPLVTRIICEVLILFFRMNDNLTAIKEKLR